MYVLYIELRSQRDWTDVLLLKASRLTIPTWPEVFRAPNRLRDAMGDLTNKLGTVQGYSAVVGEHCRFTQAPTG